MIKFKAGDKAKFKYHLHARLFILEVNEQICYADVSQTWYTGRIYYAHAQSVIKPELVKVSAIELEPIPLVSAKLDAIVTLWKAIKVEKEALIKQQKFDDAAIKRSKEKELHLEIEYQAELEGLTWDEAIAY